MLDQPMASIALLSDIDLLARLPLLVHAEYEATADVIEHLVEVERRRLYLEQATSSLYKYVRLGLLGRRCAQARSGRKARAPSSLGAR